MADSTNVPVLSKDYLEAYEQKVQGILAAAQKDGRRLTVDEMVAITDKDRLCLNHALKQLMQELWTETLSRLQEALPHRRGDGSSNDRIFGALRNGILSIGNTKARQIPIVTGDFLVQQVYDTKVERHKVSGTGIFDLPAGVKMPSEKPRNV